MKYAGKAGIPYLVVIGDDELASGTVKVKKMEDGSETEVAVADLVTYCKNNL